MKNYQKSIITIIKEKDKYEKMKEMWEMPVKNKKIWIVLIQKKNNELVNNLRNWWFKLVKSIFCFCIYKMYLIPANGHENARVDMLIIKKKLAKFEKVWKM